MNININEYLEKLKAPKNETEYKNERDELVKKTVDTLREGRKGTEWEYKLVTTKTIAILFNKKFSNNNYALYIFLTKCKNSSKFGAHFWKNIKVDMENK
jgi:hypothetical protein